MHTDDLLKRISQGRTDLVFDLLGLENWRELLQQSQVKPLQWFVYYNDVTALKAVLAAGGDLSSISLDEELAHAAFCGHWKVCDFLILHGANVNTVHSESGETPLHNALAKAGRPAFLHVIQLLVEHGADINAHTLPDAPTQAFMRDVRTFGETPLHRAAAWADETIIAYLIQQGADIRSRDARGDSPLSWASYHQRPGRILKLLAFTPHHISDKHCENLTSDHGWGWGNGMERNMLGSFLPQSLSQQLPSSDS